jgi:hypothetical protein
MKAKVGCSDDGDEEDLSQICEMLEKHRQDKLRSMQKDGIICFAKTELLTKKLDLRTEAIITVLLKIENLSEKKFLKVLPPSHEVLKIGFYKSNHEEIQKLSAFYLEFTKHAKLYRGSLMIRLVDRCNDMHIDPIDAISELQKLSSTHFLKLEYSDEVILWRYVGKMTFEEFERDLYDELLKRIMEVERNALTKLKILWTLGFLNSYTNVQAMIRRTP